MPEYRKDPITNRWVIIASERSNRPIEKDMFIASEKTDFCPFDKGNEHLTPPEVLAFRPPNSNPNDENSTQFKP